MEEVGACWLLSSELRGCRGLYRGRTKPEEKGVRVPPPPPKLKLDLKL